MRRALALVWETSPRLTVYLAVLTALAGLLPAAIAYVAKLVIDAVLLARETSLTGLEPSWRTLFAPVAVELGLVVALAAIQRSLSVCQSLLRALLGERVNEMILEKALELDLAQFEDSEIYDSMTRARREASTRPLSMVMRSFGIVQNLLSLLGFAAILWQLGPWAVAILLVAGVPSFIAELRFSGEAFRLFSWRAGETRMQSYLETLLAREDHVKEVKIYDLGPIFLDRYKQLFLRFWAEDRALTIRRGLWGFLLGAVSTIALYGVYASAVWATATGRMTLGEMTMVMLAFRQGQACVAGILAAIGGMVDDDLYLGNLYSFLALPTHTPGGDATAGLTEGDGLRFEGVAFRYPGSDADALQDIDFHVPHGTSIALVGQNGSGKTTLIKLLTRLYEPTEGRILLDGRDLRDWDAKALRSRVAVVFQDFVRYQLLAGENIGAGDLSRFQDEDAWRRAAERGLAAPVMESLPDGYHTQLGRWFKNGRELSGGQWQKVALSRAFVREQAQILVLDEPTAALDAEAEAEVFDHVRAASEGRSTVLISHRFSSVRGCDQILVMEAGRIVERGKHDSLMADDGRYAHLFRLQAAGYA